MKNSYPIILTPDEPGYTVYIPDFDVNTQGNDLTEAIEMARDAIGLLGIDMQDDGKVLPEASSIKTIQKELLEDIVTLVDVDFDEYRRKNDMRTVKKNCTIPSWLNELAEDAGINFSAALQTELKKQLHLKGR